MAIKRTFGKEESKTKQLFKNLQGIREEKKRDTVFAYKR